jgi:hypothetical protein
VREPRSAESGVGLEDYEPLFGALFKQMVRGSDAGDPGSNYQHIKVLD